MGEVRHEHFPVFYPPKLCYFLKFLIGTFSAFVSHVVTLAILLMPIDKLYFQISNCNVLFYVL